MMVKEILVSYVEYKHKYSYLSLLKRFILVSFGFIIILVVSTFVHELSHVITAILLGNEFVSFSLSILDSFLGISLDVNINFNNLNTISYVIISGSIGSYLFSLILFYISLKKLNLILFSGSMVVLVYEPFYWGISPYIKHGDSYILYNILKINNFYLISIFFYILCMLTVIICFWFLLRLANKKYLERIKI